MARERMIAQYFLARHFNGLVVGTENLSEYYLGYCTLHGDQAADINPLAGLFKAQVYQLAGYLGISQEIIETPPSAGLWEDQTDEKELGFSYTEADPILFFSIVKKYSPEKLIEEKGIDRLLVDRVLSTVKSTQFKKEPIPSTSIDLWIK